MSALAIISCDGASNPQSSQNDDKKVLNLYIWADYLAPDTIASFEKLTGVKVRVSYFETNATLETRVLTGNSGFDVVVPAATYFQRQIRSGAYLRIDKAQLPNYKNLDPAIMAQVALNDPQNDHGVVYAWGTYGIGYNKKKMVSEVLPNEALDTWRLVFDPLFASRLAKCGINFLDSASAIVHLVLRYLGKDSNAPTPEDLADVDHVLTNIRPYIRTIDSSTDIQALANGDICVGLGFNGNFFQARQRIKDSKSTLQIEYAIPKEGSLLWFDLLAIPRDAPHVANAYLFINFLMDPRVIASITTTVGQANANAAALSLLDTSISQDTIIYPAPKDRRKLFVQNDDSPELSRAITRMWQKFKTGE